MTRSYSSFVLTLVSTAAWSLLLHPLTLAVAAAAAAAGELPQCQFMRDDTVPKYHLDHACDRVAHNSFGNRARRVQRSQELHSLPTGIQQVPEEKTVTCPLQQEQQQQQQPITSSLYPPNGVTNAHIGLPTSWLVENTSKLPVVLAYVDVQTGRDYSAINSNISPPQADPQAILMPHQWKSVRTMEGHVFHVYELLGTSPGNFQLGRLVLQHRVGLVPIRNRFASPESIQCGDPATLVDEPPIVDRVTNMIEPEFQRSPEIKNEQCNVLYRGFRNLVGCPVHAYYIGQSKPPMDDGAMQCQEDFKFHLGINTLARDFEHAWDAPTKFETTFISHSFVFRLASNTSVMVDTHTFTPTNVVDCPESDMGVPLHSRHVSETVAESVVLPFGDKASSQTGVMQPKVSVLQLVMMANASTHYGKLENNTTDSYYDYYNTKQRNQNETTLASQMQGRRHRPSRNTYMAAMMAGSRAY